MLLYESTNHFASTLIFFSFFFGCRIVLDINLRIFFPLHFIAFFHISLILKFSVHFFSFSYLAESSFVNPAAFIASITPPYITMSVVDIIVYVYRRSYDLGGSEGNGSVYRYFWPQ